MKELLFVTGAPGAGKSTSLQAFLTMKSDYIVFDIDWMARSAGALAGKDIYTDESAWQPYGELWFEILHSVCKNSFQPIFFCPNSPTDIGTFGVPSWCKAVHWLLLDCDDTTRRTRLDERFGWSEERKEEAFVDATELREFNMPCVDTGSLLPEEVALKVRSWADGLALESA